MRFTKFELISILIAVQPINCEALSTASFRIGGLFNGLNQPNSVQVFQKLVEKSGVGVYHGKHLETSVIDSYSVSLELCPYTLDDHGIVALVDSRPTEGICDTICLLCNRYNVTHLSTGREPIDTLATDLFTYQYYPPPELISKAFVEVIKLLQWDKFAILYEDGRSFARLEHIMSDWNNPNEPILFKKLNPEGDNRESLKELIRVSHMNYFVLDCHLNNINKYMTEVTEVENSTEYLSFVLTDLEAYTINFENIPNLMANVSTLHLTSNINDVKWRDLGINARKGTVQLETALVADALKHVEKSLRAMIGGFSATRLSNIPSPPSLCSKDTRAEYENEQWSFGNQLRDSLFKTTIKGFTGFIDFDEFGKRTNFHLHFSKLGKDSYFKSAGSWSSRTNLITTERIVKERSKAMKPNYKIRIATKKDLPYFEELVTTNGTLQRGFVVDLIDAIFKEIKNSTEKVFEYEIYRVPGDTLGKPIPHTKKWDGILGELIDHKAELGVADITINAERLGAVDFSTPFMALGISMLFKITDPPPPDKFSFFKPFSLDVWLYLATAYIVVSFILLVCSRMSQEDWLNPHSCNLEPDSLRNMWSLYNCMWLTMGAIMTQGCDILPRGPGSRWVAGLWYFFSLIVTASYMANMSTFLRNNRRSNEIKDVEALSEQTRVSYGAVLDSSTHKFFKNSNETLFQKISDVMDTTRPSVFTSSNEEGVNRVLKGKGKYVFFMESTAIDYYTKRHCNLKMVGPKLDSKEYGIAMPKNFPHRSLIDHAILSLHQMGEIARLQTKWWEIEDNKANCKKSEADNDENGGPLKMENTSGIFLLLGFGGILGLFVAIVDFLLHAKKMSVKERITFCEAIKNEWKASLNPRDLQKMTGPLKSENSSIASTSSLRHRSQSRAVSVIRAASSFINFDAIY